MEHKDELTPLESRLVECAATGEELDCAPPGATAAELDAIDNWDDRKIRAWVLVALCTGEMADWSVHPRRGLRLRGAYITGQADLSRAQMTQCALAFHTCRFEEDIVLDQATISDLSFTSCVLPSLYGYWLNSSASLRLTETHLRQMSFTGASLRGVVRLSEVRLINPEGTALNADSMSVSSVVLENAHVEGEVSLRRANIDGQLSCREGSKLINPGSYALSADAMSASSVVLSNTHVEGEVDLGGANIDGELSCREGTKLINPEGTALNAALMSASGVFLLDTHVEGEASLGGADLSGQLICTDGTKLINPEDTALNAVSMSARDVFLLDTHVEGEVNLARANIDGELGCREGTKLINPSGYALNAEGCQVEGTLFFRLREAAVGEVNLAYAQVGTFADTLVSWPDAYNLVGFSYRSLDGDETLDQRLKWISNSKPFSPHVYSQLAEMYRRSGDEGHARKVIIERERARRSQSNLSWGAGAWNLFLDWTASYGYQPWRALVPLVLLFVLGWFLFTRPPAQEVMVHPSPNIKGPTSAAPCQEPFPCFSPPIYVLDTLLPIIDLHQESNWVPARPQPWGALYEVLTWVLIASGWILTTAVVAGIGSLWRRE